MNKIEHELRLENVALKKALFQAQSQILQFAAQEVEAEEAKLSDWVDPDTTSQDRPA